jgi:hypothetical protein
MENRLRSKYRYLSLTKLRYLGAKWQVWWRSSIGKVIKTSQFPGPSVSEPSVLPEDFDSNTKETYLHQGTAAKGQDKDW